jgi:hypothetical protein
MSTGPHAGATTASAQPKKSWRQYYKAKFQGGELASNAQAAQRSDIVNQVALTKLRQSA